MREYALEHTLGLIHKLTEALHEAARDVDEKSIHDIRVAMRRLSRCLKIFGPYYPDSYWKKIRHRLSTLMTAAGAVRDCDIAMELLENAGVSQRAAVRLKLAAERHQNGHKLRAEIRHWEDQGIQHKWKKRLAL